MVFTHKQESDQKQEITDLWTKMIGLLNQKLSRLLSGSGLSLQANEYDMVNQVNNFIRLDMAKYGVKNIIKVPKAIEINPLDYKYTTVHYEKEYSQFIRETIQFMKKHSMYKDEFINNYRIFSGANLDEDSPLNQRVFILLNQKH